MQNLHSTEVIPLSRQIVEVNKIGHGLVQSVTNGVDTTDIEQRIEELNSTWNSLQESVSETYKCKIFNYLQFYHFNNFFGIN